MILSPLWIGIIFINEGDFKDVEINSFPRGLLYPFGFSYPETENNAIMLYRTFLPHIFIKQFGGDFLNENVKYTSSGRRILGPQLFRELCVSRGGLVFLLKTRT